MNLKHLIVGSHLYFAREGETIDAIVVATDAKPDVTPTSNWTDIGEVSEATVEPIVEEIEVRAPSPGVYRTSAILQRNQGLTLTLSIQQASELLFEALFLADGAITTDYVPLSATGQIRGWWKFQQYGHDDALVNVVDLWADAKVNATRFSDDLLRYDLVLRVLNSTLNSGTISNLS